MEFKDPLEKLLGSGEEFDRTKVAEALEPLLWIDKDTLTVRWKEEGLKLSTRQQIVAFLLARKAMKALNLINSEGVESKEIVEAIGERKTVDPRLSEIVNRDKVVTKTKDNKYYIPPQFVSKALSVIAKSRKK